MARDVKVTFTPDWGAVRALSQPSGIVGRAAVNAQDATVARARRRAPVRSGRLRASIKAGPLVVTDTGPRASVVADVRYAVPVHQGGRRNRRPRPFLTDALRALSTQDFRP